jgi:hypothetical protein
MVNCVDALIAARFTPAAMRNSLQAPMENAGHGPSGKLPAVRTRVFHS